MRGDDPNILTDLGASYFYGGVGGVQKALAEFEKALAISPDNPAALFDMGILKALTMGDRKGAIKLWERLLQTNRDFPQAEQMRILIESQKQGGVLLPHISRSPFLWRAWGQSDPSC